MDAKPSFIEHYVPREQGRVYARDYGGAGPAFVLMHGFPDNLHIYDDLKLKTLDIPVKLIWGQYDPYISVAVAERRQSQLKNASLTVVPAGHWLQSDAPEQVAKAMLS